MSALSRYVVALLLAALILTPLVLDQTVAASTLQINKNQRFGNNPVTWKVALLNNYTVNRVLFPDSNTVQFNFTNGLSSSLPSNMFIVQAWNVSDKSYPKFILLTPVVTYVLYAKNYSWVNNAITVFGTSSNQTITVSYTALGSGLQAFNSTAELTSVTYNNAGANSVALTIQTASLGNIFLTSPYGAPTSVLRNGLPTTQNLQWAFYGSSTLKLIGQTKSDLWTAVFSTSAVGGPGGGQGPTAPPPTPSPPPLGSFPIQVTVIDALTGLKLSNASISIGQVKTFTNQNGTVNLGLFQGGSSYYLDVEKSGYLEAAYSTPVIAGPYSILVSMIPVQKPVVAPFNVTWLFAYFSKAYLTITTLPLFLVNLLLGLLRSTALPLVKLLSGLEQIAELMAVITIILITSAIVLRSVSGRKRGGLEPKSRHPSFARKLLPFTIGMSLGIFVVFSWFNLDLQRAEMNLLRSTPLIATYLLSTASIVSGILLRNLNFLIMGAPPFAVILMTIFIARRHKPQRNKIYGAGTIFAASALVVEYSLTSGMSRIPINIVMLSKSLTYTTAALLYVSTAIYSHWVVVIGVSASIMVLAIAVYYAEKLPREKRRRIFAISGLTVAVILPLAIAMDLKMMKAVDLQGVSAALRGLFVTLSNSFSWFSSALFSGFASIAHGSGSALSQLQSTILESLYRLSGIGLFNLLAMSVSFMIVVAIISVYVYRKWT